MSAYSSSLGPLNSPVPVKKHYWQQFGGKFLVISILVHLLLGLGAAYYVIQLITPAKKPGFTQMPVTTAVTPLDKTIKTAKIKSLGGAPASAKRATTSGLSAVVIPDVEMPAPVNAVSITPMVGGGNFPGYGPGPGGGASNGPGGPGKFMTNLGGSYNPGALTGKFYDLKLTPGKQETGMTFGKYGEVVNDFVKGTWNESHLSKYLKGTRPLYASRIFFTEIDSTEAPKAFNSPVPDSAGMWIAVYRGQVSPPESGTYHFVGAGDDDMIVRFDGKLVLHKCEHIDSPVQAEGTYHYNGLRNEFGKGTGVTVEAGKFYNIEILIGDHVPRKTMAVLLIEKESANYEHQGDAPILPPFMVNPEKGDVSVPNTVLPAHVENGPVWAGKASSTSLLDRP